LVLQKSPDWVCEIEHIITSERREVHAERDHTGSDVHARMSAQPPVIKLFASEEMKTDQQEGRMSWTHIETDMQDKQTILDPQLERNGSGLMIASEDMESEQQLRQRRACERPSPRLDHLMSRMEEQEDKHMRSASGQAHEKLPGSPQRSFVLFLLASSVVLRVCI
jgi:hypothetical protein